MNKISLELINLSYYEGAFTLLTKAKEVYHQYPRIVYPLNALDTLNNLSSCFIKFDHHHLASRTMEEARKLIFKEKLTEGTAATYINTCAVFSSMGKHVKAIENVQIGIQILEADIGQIDSSVEDIEVFKILFVDKVRLLTLAYYSMATEALEMKLTDICHNFLYKALLCAKNFLVNEVNYDKLELE
jgi:hypothetical protein